MSVVLIKTGNMTDPGRKRGENYGALYVLSVGCMGDL